MSENPNYRESYELIDFDIEFKSLVAQLRAAQQEQDREGDTDVDVSALFFEMAELVADYHQNMVQERGLYTLKPAFVIKQLREMEEDPERRLTLSHTLYVTALNVMAKRFEDRKRNELLAKREPLTAEIGEIIDHTRGKYNS